MNKSIGFALRSAVVGLVLGLLGGLLGGVDFATILLRMLLTGAILGGLGFGLYVVTQKFIPELLTEISFDKPGDDLLESELGGELNSSGTAERVNIVVDDTNATDDQAQSLRSEMSRENSPGVEQGAQDSASRQNNNSDDSSGASANGRSDSSAPMINMFTADDNDLVQEVQEDGGNAGASTEIQSDDDFYAGVDSLPDISGFSDSFHDKSFDDDVTDDDDTPEDDDIASSLSGLSGGNNAGNEDNMNDDPKIYAAAIRTALKKG